MSLVWSIIATVSAFFFGETVVFFILVRLYRLSPGFFLFFLAAEAAFHLAVALLLIGKRAFFYNLQTGLPEHGVNLSNKITLFRITMLPFLLFLIAAQKHGVGPVLVIASALTFASDFFDGRLARAKNMETYMGKLLDSASDYLLLGTITAAFFLLARLKTWLFAVIIGRLCINALGMTILSLVRKKLSPQTTFLGKVAIAAIMVLLVIESLALFMGVPFWLGYVEAAAGITVGLSVFDKVVYFVKAAGQMS